MLISLNNSCAVCVTMGESQSYSSTQDTTVTISSQGYLDNVRRQQHVCRGILATCHLPSVAAPDPEAPKSDYHHDHDDTTANGSTHGEAKDKVIV